MEQDRRKTDFDLFPTHRTRARTSVSDSSAATRISTSRITAICAPFDITYITNNPFLTYEKFDYPCPFTSSLKKRRKKKNKEFIFIASNLFIHFFIYILFTKPAQTSSNIRFFRNPHRQTQHYSTPPYLHPPSEKRTDFKPITHRPHIFKPSRTPSN